MSGALSSLVTGAGAAGGPIASAASSIVGQYLQCSFRGIPFVVVGSGGRQGRRFAVHEYPFRDTVWPEDMGRGPRTYRVRGFITGALCYVQRDLLANAAETRGSGLLMHPTVGVIKAACTRFEWYERDGVMNVIDLEMEFVEAANYLTTTILAAAHAVIAAGSLAFSQASASDYGNDVATPFSIGNSVDTAAKGVASDWANTAASAIVSPTALSSAIVTLPGNNGRYAAGNGNVVDQSATIGSVLTALTVAQQGIVSDIGALSSADGAASLATAILAIPEALRTSIADPGAQIALLMPLADCSPTITASSAPIGGAIASAQTATAALCRRAAIVSLAQSCSDYQPTSQQDAATLQSQIAAVMDAEALTAADSCDDATWSALTQLRASVMQDLSDRASRLPGLVTVTRNQPLSSLVLAQQLYADATRAPDLTRRADPVHPAFMPTSFEALSS